LACLTAATLDPESMFIDAHAEREHLGRFAAVTVNPVSPGTMKIESARTVEPLMACAAFAPSARQPW